MVNQKIEYLHFIPLNSGYIDDHIHWRYTSARNYSCIDGLIPVTLFDG